MRTSLLLGSLLVAAACQSAKEPMKQNALAYPETKRVDSVDVYFGVEVADPYRWLEDDRSDETAAWVAAQNEVTQRYLEQIPYRDDIRRRLTTLWDYEKYGTPTRQGDAYYFFKNDGLQNQSAMYRLTDLDGAPELFLDPNRFADDGTIALADVSFTEDGGLMAYAISESGSDWQKILVMDVATRTLVGDTLLNVKFSGISWRGREGFYYSSYDQQEGTSALSAINQQHKLYFHRMGTPQSQDPLVFGGATQPFRYVRGSVTEDDRYLAISAANGTSGNQLYLRDLSRPDAPLQTVVDNVDHNHSLVHNEGTTLYIYTNLDAPNYRLVAVDAADPRPANWRNLVAEREEVLTSVSVAGGKMFLNYLKDASTRLYQTDLRGTVERQIELPALGTAAGFGGRHNDQTLFYAFTSFTYPTTIYRYDVATGTSTLFRQPTVPGFDPAAYETKQVFYTSKDGTRVPMFIVHKKGLTLDGQNPTWLYAYGGFNISLTPVFSVTRLYWLENGGVYALPNLRGGGEYGEAWHEAGTKLKKQNVFDDFIAAGAYLQSEGYTSPEKMVISGGSNGGLLVGATMTQRPDLAAVALPAVGVMDMLRFQRFTAGAGWTSDYGNADENAEMFAYLRGYSPLHNIKEGGSLPRYARHHRRPRRPGGAGPLV